MVKELDKFLLTFLSLVLLALPVTRCSHSNSSQAKEQKKYSKINDHRTVKHLDLLRDKYGLRKYQLSFSFQRGNEKNIYNFESGPTRGKFLKTVRVELGPMTETFLIAGVLYLIEKKKISLKTHLNSLLGDSIQVRGWKNKKISDLLEQDGTPYSAVKNQLMIKVIEKISEVPIKNFLENRFFHRPTIDMESTYVKEGKITSTTHDLVKWGRSFLKGELFSEFTLRQTRQLKCASFYFHKFRKQCTIGQNPSTPFDDARGAGIMRIYHPILGTIWFHAGGDRKVRSMFAYLEKDNLVLSFAIPNLFQDRQEYLYDLLFDLGKLLHQSTQEEGFKKN